jgi:hypothetical protein
MTDDFGLLSTSYSSPSLMIHNMHYTPISLIDTLPTLITPYPTDAFFHTHNQCLPHATEEEASCEEGKEGEGVYVG